MTVIHLTRPRLAQMQTPNNAMDRPKKNQIPKNVQEALSNDDVALQCLRHFGHVNFYKSSSGYLTPNEEASVFLEIEDKGGYKFNNFLRKYLEGFLSIGCMQISDRGLAQEMGKTVGVSVEKLWQSITLHGYTYGVSPRAVLIAGLCMPCPVGKKIQQFFGQPMVQRIQSRQVKKFLTMAGAEVKELVPPQKLESTARYGYEHLKIYVDASVYAQTHKTIIAAYSPETSEAYVRTLPIAPAIVVAEAEAAAMAAEYWPARDILTDNKECVEFWRHHSDKVSDTEATGLGVSLKPLKRNGNGLGYIPREENSMADAIARLTKQQELPNGRYRVEGKFPDIELTLLEPESPVEPAPQSVSFVDNEIDFVTLFKARLSRVQSKAQSVQEEIEQLREQIASKEAELNKLVNTIAQAETLESVFREAS
jgi:hypothetical protein